MLNPVMTFSGNRLVPLYDGAKLDNVALRCGQTLAYGTVLGQVTGSGTAVNDVQTVTITGTPTSGTFALQYGTQVNIPAIPYNATAAQLQLKINNAFGVGNTADTRAVVCTLGPLPGTAIAITFSGNDTAGMSHVLFTATNGLGGGATPAVTVAHTTNGMPAGGYYDAYVDGNTDGTGTARRLLEYDCTVAFNGTITWGTSDASPFGGGPSRCAPAYYHGVFKTDDLTGLDAAGVTDLGRLISGSLTVGTYGILAINGGG